MSFYKKYQEAWDDQDIGAMLELYHPDYKRVFHAKGIEQGLDDLEPMVSVVKAALPFLGVLFVFLTLVTYIPWISTFLPNMIMGPEIILK